VPTKFIDFPSWDGAYAREMYLRHTTRVKDGKVHTYWRLVRAVRMERKVVQQTVAQLGELDAEGRARAKALARTITGEREQADLFVPASCAFHLFVLWASCRPPPVFVMKSTDARHLHHPALARSLHAPGLGASLVGIVV
jgi:hypothetical protein